MLSYNNALHEACKNTFKIFQVDKVVPRELAPLGTHVRHVKNVTYVSEFPSFAFGGGWSTGAISSGRWNSTGRWNASGRCLLAPGAALLAVKIPLRLLSPR